MHSGSELSGSSGADRDRPSNPLSEGLQKLAGSDGEDFKRFEAVSKHYHDVFNYHAGQRLTSFNFFILSLSFFSNGYAILISKGEQDHRFFLVAAGLAMASYGLVIMFGRLDKRNEQIIEIDERPILLIQRVFQARYGGSGWESFRAMEDEKKPFCSFGRILPRIYTLGATLAAAGAVAALFLDSILGVHLMALLWGVASMFAGWAIDGWPKREAWAFWRRRRLEQGEEHGAGRTA